MESYHQNEEESELEAAELLQQAVINNGNLVETGGVCSSVTLTGIRSFLSGEPEFENWQRDIQVAIENVKDEEEPVTEGEKVVINKPLLNLLSIVQLPHYHPTVFNQPYTQQTSKEVIQFINQNICIGKPDMFESYRQAVAIDVQTFCDHLASLKKLASKQNRRMACYLGNEEHAFGIGIDKNGFVILDISQFPFESYEKAYSAGVDIFAKFQEEKSDAESKDEEGFVETDIDINLKQEADDTYVTFEIIYFANDPVLLHLEHDLHLKQDYRMINDIQCDDNLTLAHVAARFGHADVIYELGQNNGLLNVSLISNGVTPTYVAAQQGNLEVLEVLRKFLTVDEMNKPNGFDYTPLAVASQWGHSAVVNFFIKAGCPLESQLLHQPSPLFVAVLENRIDIIKILLDAGANMHAVMSKNKELFPLFCRSYDISPSKVNDLMATSDEVVYLSPFQLANLLGNEEILKLFNELNFSKVSEPVSSSTATVQQFSEESDKKSKRRKLDKTISTSSHAVLPPGQHRNDIKIPDDPNTKIPVKKP